MSGPSWDPLGARVFSNGSAESTRHGNDATRKSNGMAQRPQNLTLTDIETKLRTAHVKRPCVHADPPPRACPEFNLGIQVDRRAARRSAGSARSRRARVAMLVSGGEGRSGREEAQEQKKEEWIGSTSRVVGQIAHEIKTKASGWRLARGSSWRALGLIGSSHGPSWHSLGLSWGSLRQRKSGGSQPKNFRKSRRA